MIISTSSNRCFASLSCLTHPIMRTACPRLTSSGELADTKGSWSFVGASLRLWIGVESLTVDGTAVGRDFKKESIDQSIFFFLHLLISFFFSCFTGDCSAMPFFKVRKSSCTTFYGSAAFRANDITVWVEDQLWCWIILDHDLLIINLGEAENISVIP